MIGGNLINKLFVKKDLDKIFYYRKRLCCLYLTTSATNPKPEIPKWSMCDFGGVKSPIETVMTGYSRSRACLKVMH